MDERISVERIAAAYGVIDAAFLDTPQYLSEPLSRRLGLDVVLKVETVNPIRSFKGRGTDLVRTTRASSAHRPETLGRAWPTRRASATGL